MELKELEYVIAIAEEGSISHAAERLFMAQSSLSQFLSKYESEMGVKLFMRTASGVRLTYSGEIFVQNARQILRQYQQMKGELADVKTTNSGKIEFGISSFRGSFILPPVLKEFNRQYPNIEVVIHEHDTVKLRELVSQGRLDMALVALNHTIDFKKDASVMRDEIYIVAREEHPVMAFVNQGEGGPNRPWVEFSDAARFEFLLSNPNTVLGWTAQDLYLSCGKKPIATNQNLTASFAAQMARSGLGLALTYRVAAFPQPGVVYLSIGKSRRYVDLVVEYPPGGYRSRAARALEEMLRAKLKQ